MKNSTKKALIYAGVLSALFVATGAHAEAWDEGAGGVKDIMYGPVGTTLAIIGLAGSAIMGFMGKLDWGKVGMIIAAIIVFFSAPAIVSFIKNRTSTTFAAIEYKMPAYAMAPVTALVPQRA